MHLVLESAKASGATLGEIPPDLKPNWENIRLHNSAIDEYGNVRMPVVGDDPFQTVGTPRYYEGLGAGSISVQDSLAGQIKISPIYEKATGGIRTVGWTTSTTSTTTDEQTGAVTQSRSITILQADGKTVAGRRLESSTYDAGANLNDPSGSAGKLSSSLVVNYTPDGRTIKSTEVTERLANGNLFTTARDGAGLLSYTVELQRSDTLSTIATRTFPNGRVEILSTDDSGAKSSLLVKIPSGNNTEIVESYNYSADKATLQSRRTTEYFYDEMGVSRIETTATSAGVFRNTFDTEGNITHSQQISSAGLNSENFAAAATAFSDLNGLIGAIRSGQSLPVLASGLRLTNSLATANGTQLPDFAAGATSVAAGSLSFYNLYNALNRGDDLAKVNATLSTISYANIALNTTVRSGQTVFTSAAADSLNTALNGTGVVGGVPGILPALGLVASIRAKDPIGIATSLGTLIQGSAFLTSNPLGWVLIGAGLLKAVFASGPPKAWGVASVSYGTGTNNLLLNVNSTGESFGSQRAASGLQTAVDYLTQQVALINAGRPANEQVGLIAQRMPTLAWRANDAGDPGYRITDIDPLTGEQRLPLRRFGDNGLPFSADPAQYQVDPSDPAQRAALAQAMVHSALGRGAIAPIWEVRTAKLQADAGAVDAGLSEEERAAKAGVLAPLDNAYSAAHPNAPEAKNKRQGHFMVAALDLDGSGTITTQSVAQNSGKNLGAGISFDWDNQGYLKKVGSVATNDGVLVLDRDFNNSVDNGTEMLSNPLVQDSVKGLRSLAVWDANGDGRIDAQDPIFQQLKVWRDYDQDGNNTHVLTVPTAAGVQQYLAQDENTQGQLELQGLAELGIVAIDFANSRYELANGQFRSIQTVQLDAEQDGVRYTPVGAGIRIQSTDGQSLIQITQIKSEAAVYDSIGLATAGETVGTSEAPLFEDGLPTAYDPVTQPYLTQVINGAQLLANDTYKGKAGVDAGLKIKAVGGRKHLQSLELDSDGNVRYQLEANFNGASGFTYTVEAPDGSTSVASVALNVTPVQDNPRGSVAYSAPRPIYGYKPLNYNYTLSYGGEDGGSTTKSGTVRGDAYYAPYTEVIPGAPIYGWVPHGEDGSTWEIVDYQPSTTVQRNTAIGQDSSNTGVVTAVNPDGGNGTTFTFAIKQGPLFGDVKLDQNTGAWNYVGNRPRAFAIGDVTGDRVTDYADPDTGAVISGANVALENLNMLSNRYGPDEEKFTDPFTISITGSDGSYNEVTVNATHYGPRPIANVAGSGGKKPIAIDLNGDGFHFKDVDDSNVFFDVNGDGWKRRIAWNSNADGFLVYDKDDDGKASSFDEISFVPWAKDQQTDLAALRKAFDSNNDGLFDARDDKWAKFGVWQDANGNGVTDAGEFKTLDAMGITAINLDATAAFEVIDGQTVHGRTTATSIDGSTLAVADVTLRYRNQTQVTTQNADGTTSVQSVNISSFQQGQTFTGTTDRDLVFGTRGNDHFDTGDGDDVIVDDQGDDLVEAGAGNDMVYTGAGNDVVDAGTGDDMVYAGAGNDLVFGGDGNDLLMLEAGNDVAFGGAGNDFISGGEGNDALSGNAGDDKLFGETGWDALFGQEGDDELYGMDGNDLLVGDEGNDLLDGGAGDDEMEGGLGDDTYVVDSAGDLVKELSGEGIDTVRSSINYTLGSAVENLTLTGTANLSGEGNASNNLLIGNDGNNSLVGGAGNDTLDGGRGADTLVGGLGNDTYFIGNPSEIIVENAGEGSDTVRSSVNYTLGACQKLCV